MSSTKTPSRIDYLLDLIRELRLEDISTFRPHTSPATDVPRPDPVPEPASLPDDYPDYVHGLTNAQLRAERTRVTRPIVLTAVADLKCDVIKSEYQRRGMGTENPQWARHHDIW